VVNARDAMPTGGRIHIELDNVVLDQAAADRSGREAGQYVRLSVADTGCGMTPEVASQIFEPFFTTKAEDKGTGLGLATVYGIVQQSGGTIDVDSQPGVGTTFRICLPRATGEIDAVPEPAVGRTGGEETILLVEDDERLRGLIGSLLGTCGYSVLEATSGEEAVDIALARPSPIDLLLTDVVMPGMSGRVAWERIASFRPETRVLFMSGHSGDTLQRHGIPTTLGPFIQKPFSVDQLAAKIREVLAVAAVS
jgi:two-component system cell cycle sensor histidine kinase/response regulator CckA